MKELNKATINDIRNKRTDLVELVDELNDRKALPDNVGDLQGSKLYDLLSDDFEEILLDYNEIPVNDIVELIEESINTKLRNRHWIIRMLDNNKYDLEILREELKKYD